MNARQLVAGAHDPETVTRAIEAIAAVGCIHDLRGVHLWLTGILAPAVPSASASRN